MKSAPSLLQAQALALGMPSARDRRVVQAMIDRLIEAETLLRERYGQDLRVTQHFERWLPGPEPAQEIEVRVQEVMDQP